MRTNDDASIEQPHGISGSSSEGFVDTLPLSPVTQGKVARRAGGWEKHSRAAAASDHEGFGARLTASLRPCDGAPPP